MNSKTNLFYERPTTEVVHVQTEGVICESTLEPLSPFTPGGDPLTA